MNELFGHITKIIAHPHTAILEHDKLRAVKVFLAFDEYLIDALPDYCKEGKFDFDFGDYANKILDELEGK